MIRFHPNEPGQPVPSEGTPLTDWSCDLAIPASALAIGAHPDDVEFGCGATLAKWAAAGCVVHILILTDGSKGTWDPDIDPDLLRRTRREEQRDAARRLGATGEVMFLDEIDGELESSLALRREVIRRIRTVRPVVVLGHDPWRRYRIHPDHRHAGWLVCDAIAGSRDPLFDPDPTLAHHRVSTVLLWEADAPNHVENVTGHVETKLSALEAHASQYRSTMRAEGEDEMEAFRHRIRERLIGLGRPHDMGSAEIFVRLDDV